jgi:septum formation protein
VLEKWGYEFEVMSADIDEKAIRFDDPKKLTLALAHAKTDALLEKIKEPAILITSDQVVVCDGQILEKPADEKEARQFLQKYALYPAKTLTAVVVTNTKSGEMKDGVDIAQVWFYQIPEEVIVELIKEGDMFSRAGGFSIEEPLLEKYIKKIEGERESIIGLPKALTLKLISEVEDKN